MGRQDFSDNKPAPVPKRGAQGRRHGYRPNALVELYMSLPDYPDPYICARDFQELCADMKLRDETVAAIIELYVEQYFSTNSFFVPHLRKIVFRGQRVYQRESDLIKKGLLERK